MLRRALVLACLLVLPSVATAQRGGGSKGGKKDDTFGREDKVPVIRSRDIEDQSPLKLLIDKKKDLKLTDAQVSQLKDTENKLKDRNAPLFKSVDSLAKEMRPGFGGNTMGDSLRMDNVMTALKRVIGTVQTNYDASATEAVAGLDAEQQAKAKDLVAKQRDDADAMLRNRLRVAPKP